MDQPNLFETLLLDSHRELIEAGRTQCPECNGFRKYYCYDCCVPLVPFPKVQLPIKATVLKCKKEPRSKSSVMVVKVICPDTSEIVNCLGEDDSVPDFPVGTMLLFPGQGSRNFCELSSEEILGITNLVFIDSTWHQTKSMLRNKKIQSLPMIKLENHTTAFWRYQNESKNSLATIEAVYYAFVDFYKDLHRRGVHSDGYQGQYDNLLWHFVFNYNRIQEEYTEKKHKGKEFRKIPNYIKPAKG